MDAGTSIDIGSINKWATHLNLPGGVLLHLDPEEGPELIEHPLSTGAAALHELEQDEDENQVPTEAGLGR